LYEEQGAHTECGGQGRLQGGKGHGRETIHLERGGRNYLFLFIVCSHPPISSGELRRALARLNDLMNLVLIKEYPSAKLTSLVIVIGDVGRDVNAEADGDDHGGLII
jgi:hypothetical protein